MSLQIIRVQGNHSNNLDNASNVLIASPDQKYSSKGLGSYLDVEVAHADNIAGVAIGFFKGSSRKTKFSVASTDDFVKFNHVQNFASSGLKDDVEEFFFDKPVKAKGLRISFLGTYSNKVTFDQNALKTAPNDCAGFAGQIAQTANPSTQVTGTATGVGADDGTINDWFSVTQVGILSKSLADIQKEEAKAAEKKQDQELKSLSKDIAKLKANDQDDCCCDDGHSHSSSGNKIQADKDSNASTTATGDRAARNNTGRVVTDSKVNNSGNVSSAKDTVAKSDNASTPTNKNTGVKDSLTLKSNEKPSSTDADKSLGNLKANNNDTNKTVTPLSKKDNVEVSKSSSTSETVTETK